MLVAVAFIAFSMFRFVGDPIANMMGQEATLQDREELSRAPRPHRALARAVWPTFIGNAAQGEFGVSYRQGRKVSDLIQERLPATVELAVLSALFATIVGILLGVYVAINRTGFLSNAIMSLSPDRRFAAHLPDRYRV